MSLLLVQLRRDLAIALRDPGDIVNPLMFYVVTITLFTLGVGPAVDTLSALAPGVIWVLALLATLLSLEGLLRRDYEDGSLEQLVMGAEPLFVALLGKVGAHWLVTGLPLTLLTPFAALVLYLPVESLPTLIVSLLLGTPVLSLVGAVGAALTVNLGRSGLLLALLVLPLYIPVLIFGSSAVTAVAIGLEADFQLAWLAVLLALAATLAPFALAAAVRIGLDQ